MIRISSFTFIRNKAEAAAIPPGKKLINTINAYSFTRAQKDPAFVEALRGGDALLPDGHGMIWGSRMVRMENRPEERVAGWDLFVIEMEKLNAAGGVCMFLGSSEAVLEKIRTRCATDYPNIRVETYSPPYKPEFSDEDNAAMVAAVNACKPDLLWIGMTAPKQEKWAWAHWKELDIHCHCGTIGAVFDFFAGTLQRAPVSWQKNGFEWLYRIIKEPRRMMPRTVSYPVFHFLVFKERFLRRIGR